MIVAVGSSGVEVICVACGTERSVAYAEVQVSADDPACLRPPDCPTCAELGVESFEVWHWHDDVVVKRRTKLQQIGTSVEDGEPIYALELVEEVRPDDPRAMYQQMVEEVAKKIGGCERAKRNRPRNGELPQYPEKPKHIAPDDVRNGVAIGLMRKGKQVLPSFLP